MIDARQAIAEDLASRVFTRLFVRPKGWTDEQAAEHIGSTVQAVRPYLPRDRPEALGVVERVAQRLKAEAKTNAWPTVREVLEAIQAETRRARVAAQDASGWPHQNSEEVVASTARWIRTFGSWPGYLGHPDKVAGELLARGLCTDADLADAGYGPALDRRVTADRERTEALIDRAAAALAMPGCAATPAGHAEGQLELPSRRPETDAQVAERVRGQYRLRYGSDMPTDPTAAEIEAYRRREGIGRP